MPERRNMRDPTEIIFGSGINKRSKTALAAAVGVTPRTLYAWSKQPDLIPKGKLDIIIRVCGLSDDEVLELHGRKGGKR